MQSWFSFSIELLTRFCSYELDQWKARQTSTPFGPAQTQYSPVIVSRLARHAWFICRWDSRPPYPS